MSVELPDFTTWTDERLAGQRDHLGSLLMISVGQKDPWKPRLRAEFKAIREEINRRATAQPSAPVAGKE